MERRKFIQLTALSSASAFLLNGRMASAFSSTELLNNIDPAILDGRSLVLVQLKGGNDGLNTIIPLAQMADYNGLRPTIGVPVSGTNKGIELDSALAPEDEIMLHPRLQPFKDLYLAGKMHIIHGVGYPLMNKSHFAAQAMMFRGADGNTAQNTGWMARFIQSQYSPLDNNDPNINQGGNGAYNGSGPDPLGVQLGTKKPSVGFYSNHDVKADVNLTGQDISGYYSVLNSLGDDSNMGTDMNPNYNWMNAGTDNGDNLEYITGVEDNAISYAQRISYVFEQGSQNAELYRNDYSEQPFYVGSDGYGVSDLSDQLKTVAKMIKGGSRTKIFIVSIDGFDNHKNQTTIKSGITHTKGKHALLLDDLAFSIKAFQTDLEGLGNDSSGNPIADNVVTATFTEFGRKPKENGNQGTDHGNLGSMFVFGSLLKKRYDAATNPTGEVNAQISGSHLDLSSVTKHYDETDMQNDYRTVFSTLVGDWLGGSSQAITDSGFGSYDNRLDIFYADENSLGVDDADVSAVNELSIFPNPVEGYCNLRMNSSSMFRGSIVVYTMNGAVVFKTREDFMPGENNMRFDMSHLSTGLYIVSVKDDNDKTQKTFKMIKK